MKSTLGLLFWILLSACAHAGPQGLLDGQSLQPLGLDQAIQQVQPGNIVIIGENHGLKAHQRQQLEVLRSLRQKGLKVSVGMEFFTYTDQSLVDSFRRGDISEPAFLKAISWGSLDYGFYRDQVAFPSSQWAESTEALNAPRSLTSQVAKQGLESLTPEMKVLLPPHFSLGREAYKKRFLGQMPHLPTPEAGERYFAAQSIWDDTMAWRAVDFIERKPDQVLVIIVGEFHTQYGGGLPDRIRARKPNTNIWTFSQINTDQMSDEEIAQAIAPSLEDGPRGQFLWLESAAP